MHLDQLSSLLVLPGPVCPQLWPLSNDFFCVFVVPSLGNQLVGLRQLQ